jgi:hypothetical protein
MPAGTPKRSSGPRASGEPIRRDCEPVGVERDLRLHVRAAAGALRQPAEFVSEPRKHAVGEERLEAGDVDAGGHERVITAVGARPR